MSTLDMSVSHRPVGARRRRRSRFGDRRLLALLTLSFALSAAWALATPLPIPGGPDYFSWANYNADEGSHISVILYLADHAALPPYAPPYDTSVHPPLYHASAAVVVALLRSMFGISVALLSLRLLSALMGAGIVYLTYRSARYLLPRRAAWLAATVVALVPMRVSVSGAISNENLAALGAAGALATLIAGLHDRRRGFDAGRLALLALWTAVAAGSKITGLGLLPALTIALIWAARRRRLPAWRGAGRALLVIGAVGAVTGWWFAQNVVQYGDPFRSAAADRIWSAAQPGAAVLCTRWHITPVTYACILALYGWKTFWGDFDGLTRSFPLPLYAALAAASVGAAVGLARSERLRRICSHPDGRAIAMVVLTFALWVGFVFFAYNWRHCSPQGRYFFVLLIPFGILTALGWRGLFAAPLRARADLALTALLLGANLYALATVPASARTERAAGLRLSQPLLRRPALLLQEGGRQ